MMVSYEFLYVEIYVLYIEDEKEREEDVLGCSLNTMSVLEFAFLCLTAILN